MNVYVVQTAYYGWVGGVFATSEGAEKWLDENRHKHPKDQFVVHSFLIEDIPVKVSVV